MEAALEKLSAIEGLRIIGPQTSENRGGAISFVVDGIHAHDLGQILDDEGEAALTFRALSARLATGSGAIYWHVANKSELLAAATDETKLDAKIAERSTLRVTPPRIHSRARLWP